MSSDAGVTCRAEQADRGDDELAAAKRAANAVRNSLPNVNRHFRDGVLLHPGVQQLLDRGGIPVGDNRLTRD